MKAASIHDLAREFLSNDGLKLKDTQKKAVFDFADWVFQKAAQQSAQPTCLNCGNTEDNHVGRGHHFVPDLSRR